LATGIRNAFETYTWSGDVSYAVSLLVRAIRTYLRLTFSHLDCDILLNASSIIQDDEGARYCYREEWDALTIHEMGQGDESFTMFEMQTGDLEVLRHTSTILTKIL
jgi:hypothetical protein